MKCTYLPIQLVIHWSHTYIHFSLSPSNLGRQHPHTTHHVVNFLSDNFNLSNNALNESKVRKCLGRSGEKTIPHQVVIMMIMYEPDILIHFASGQTTTLKPLPTYQLTYLPSAHRTSPLEITKWVCLERNRKLQMWFRWRLKRGAL